MKNRLTIALMALLFILPTTVCGLAEPADFEVAEIAYKTLWAYYDGRVAEICIQQTAKEPNVSLKSAMWNECFSEPSEDGGITIGSYCEFSFSYEGSTGQELWRGGGTNEGRSIEDSAYLFLPKEASPAFVDVDVTVGARTKDDHEDDKGDSFTVRIPKEGNPLLEKDELFDLGGTQVTYITVSRTPSKLVLNLYHRPTVELASQSFNVFSADDTALANIVLSDTHPNMPGGLVWMEKSYDLPLGEPVPTKLRLHYNGGLAKELLLHLDTGEVEILEP